MQQAKRPQTPKQQPTQEPSSNKNAETTSQQESTKAKNKKTKQQNSTGLLASNEKPQVINNENNTTKDNSNNNNQKKVKKAKNETQPKENQNIEKKQKENNQKEKKESRNEATVDFPPPVIVNTECYEYIPKFTFESAKELIEKGNFHKASQGINELLLSPIEYLCYALNLNQKANNLKAIQEIGAKINKLVGYKPNSTIINLKKYSWVQIWPYLDFLIGEIFKSTTIERTEINYILKNSKSPSYVEEIDGKILEKYVMWTRIMLYLGYPYAVGFSRQDCDIVSLQTTNYVIKERESRKLDYHFFKGELDEDNIRPDTFYNLIARIGLTREHFLAGKYGFKDMIRVYPFTIETVFERIEDLYQFAETFIKEKMEKTAQPYVVIVFSFSNGHKVQRSIIRYESDAGIYEGATILETDENRIYYAFINDKRKILDLHKMSLDEAIKKVQELIQLRYDSGDKECSIITGKGNHVNENGTSGVLRDKIGQLLKNHPHVKSANYQEGKYTVKINQ